MRGIGLVLIIWVGLVLGCGGGPSNPSSSPQSTATLTAEHRAAINTALKAKKIPPPQTLELTGLGVLVATYEMRGPVTPISLRQFAEKSLIAIREAMLPFHPNPAEAYRVTLNGPSPGTGLIRTYGSARFVEGGQVDWDPAK